MPVPRPLLSLLSLPRPSFRGRTAALLAVLALCGLTACVPGAGGGKGAGPEVSPLASDAITVTPLDAPGVATPAEAAPGSSAPGSSAPGSSAPGTADAGAADAAAADPTGPDAAPEAPATDSATDAATDAEGAAAGEAEVPADAAPPKTPAQIACEKDGGRWAVAGDSGARACVRQTRDGGKQCRRKSDCEGQCLARSGTCSPIMPLFGCNEVLQDNGARVTLCLD